MLWEGVGQCAFVAGRVAGWGVAPKLLPRRMRRTRPCQTSRTRAKGGRAAPLPEPPYEFWEQPKGRLRILRQRSSPAWAERRLKVESIMGPDDFFEPMHRDIYAKCLETNGGASLMIYNIVRATLGSLGAGEIMGMSVRPLARIVWRTCSTLLKSTLLSNATGRPASSTSHATFSGILRRRFDGTPWLLPHCAWFLEASPVCPKEQRRRNPSPLA
jgi:hypothetical protein